MKVHLVHHTHFDIGFTDQPEEVVRQQLLYLDQALRLCEGDSAYRWTIESGRLLREWLASRPQSLRERLLALLREGRMELAALDMQILTETATFSELVANTRSCTQLGREYGFPVKTAILDDIGGLAGEMPTALNDCGVQYLILGTSSCQTEVPWADLPYLFWLRSRAGGRLLVWNLGCDRQEPSTDSKLPYAGYGEGAMYLGYHAFPEYLGELDIGVFCCLAGEEREAPMSTRQAFGLLEERLKRNGYPYDEILLQYGGDNRPPAAHLPQLVAALNASGDFPQITLGTATGFFERMEEKHGAEIPELEGLFTDPWNLRINAVPSVLKTARATQRLDEALRLTGCHDEQVREDLLLVADHTLGLNIWGWQDAAAKSADGIRDEAFDEVRKSWRRKRLYAEQAWRRANELEHRMLCKQEETQAVVVRNLAPHAVDGPAELYLGSYAPRLLALKDADGNEVPRQLVGQNRWLLWAEGVPALGLRRLQYAFDSAYDQPYTPLTGDVPTEAPCGAFRLQFRDGALAQILSADGRPLLEGPFALGEPLCETIGDVPKTNEHCCLKECTDRTLARLERRTAALTADGPLFTEVTQHGRLAKGAARVIYRLWKKAPRLEVRVRLDQPETADKRAFYVAFPFAGQGGRHLFDQNAGLATLDRLLPGAMQDLFLCSRYAALETEGLTAVLCCPDAPIVEFGGLNTARWRKPLPYMPQSNSIISLVANNICNTDAPAWSPVCDEFSFSLFLHEGAFSATQAQRDFETATALSARISFAAETAPLPNLPPQIRLHSADDGLWLENLTDTAVAYDFAFQGRRYAGTLAPFALQHK